MPNDQPKPQPKDKSHDAPPVPKVDHARDVQAVNRMADKSAKGTPKDSAGGKKSDVKNNSGGNSADKPGKEKLKESVEGKKSDAKNDSGENPSDKAAASADKKSAKKDVNRLGQTRAAESSDQGKPASDKTTKGKTDKNSSEKTKSDMTIKLSDHLQSHDYTDPVAKLERAGEYLNKRIELLNNLKEQYSSYIEDTKKGVDAEFEKVKSTGETVDNVATVATIAVNIGGIASKGADALKASGEALVKINRELAHDAGSLALDPLKDAGKDRLSKLADSKLNDGFGKYMVELALGYAKPSYWAQLFTGKIGDAHKDAIEKLDRSRAETNDKYDAEIYNTRQQLLEVNAQRDEINSSRGNR